MQKPNCDRASKATMRIDGFMGDYLRGVTEQWLLVAPNANPGMLEMFRDRDCTPLRNITLSAGELAGKYLTSAVQVLRVTGDLRLRAHLKEFVPRLISCQAEDGYLGPWPKECRLTNYDSEGKGTWDTWGHYHIMLGLILWHEETGDKKAFECATRIADLICRKYQGKKRTRLVDTNAPEMNLAPIHALCILYRKTNDGRYLDMALQIADEFSARGEKGPLTGDYLRLALAGKEFFEMPRHRWESLHPIMGLAELHWITGEDRYREAFEHIWWSIVKLDRHNNGGFSSVEQALGNPYHKGAIETCCTIAWIAMSVEMLKMSGNSIVADEIELSTLNSVAGMHSPSGRWATYNTPMNGIRLASAHHIVHHSREGLPELNCCSVNSPRGFGMISDWALMKDKEGLLLNYYGPSVISAKVKRGLSVTLTQETQYPIDGRIALRVTPSRAAEFALKLRIPYWSARTKVRLNGEAISGVKPGRYAVIERRWKSNDRVEIDLDMSLHFWVGERECKGLTSVYRGPVLLAFDHRYNRELSRKGKKIRPSTSPKVLEAVMFGFEDCAHACDYEKWETDNYLLRVPVLDAKRLSGRLVDWNDWIPPVMLLEFKSAGGKAIRLCDFGSAGETGTAYLSWLPIKHKPKATKFSRANPLRSSRPQKS